MKSNARGVIRWAWLSLTPAAGAYCAAPHILKRAFAPPQRDVGQAPRDLGLPEHEM